ncbi:MAG: hypothetical protein KC549_09995 [Myxococcales bacterium]|nr:hypothetical protein [Myxococcales bacterium]
MSPAVLTHMALGGLALALYWTALTARKGGARHRRAGRAGLALLVLTSLSVAPILFARPFDPGYVVQLVYLATCLTTVAALAFNAIRFKADPDRFRGPLLRRGGPVLLGLGLVVLAAGLAKGDPVAVTLSWVGLVYGTAMIRFARRPGPVHPRWWLSWHLDAVAGLFNAVHGTVLFVVARGLQVVPDTPAAQAGFQVATMAMALGLRVYYGRKYRAPLRLRAVGDRRALA